MLSLPASSWLRSYGEDSLCSTSSFAGAAATTSNAKRMEDGAFPHPSMPARSAGKSNGAFPAINAGKVTLYKIPLPQG